MSTPKRYVEQFERVKRYYERFKELNSGRQHCLSAENYEDDVYSFFINCHHLKDWIINDPAATVTKQNVEDYIDSVFVLKICADICNGAKHLTRRAKRVRSGKERSIKSKAYNVTILEGSTKPPKITIKFFIENNLDAFEVATECVQKWEEFIKKHNI